MPKVEPGEEAPYEYGDEDFGGDDVDGYDYGAWDLAEDDDPSLALPPDYPSDGWPGELIEPSLENGEAFLPDIPPEEAPLVLAEPLPEPAPPDMPELAVGPESASDGSSPDSAEGSGPEDSPDLAGDPSEIAEEPEPVPPPESAPPLPLEPPPPPPRIVRPSEPVAPPPPVRETPPMPPKAPPDLPARNPPTLAPVPAEPPGVSSRVVRALAGQTVEVPFRGTGWVYLGEASSKRGVDYASRRLDAEGQTFVFRAGEAGVYGLKFYRQDFIRDYIINDLVTLIVEEPPPALSDPPSSRRGAAVDRGVVVAEPRWPAIAGRTAPETGSPAPPIVQAGSAPPASGAPTQAGSVPDAPIASTGTVPSVSGAPTQAGTVPGAPGALSQAGIAPPESAAQAGDTATEGEGAESASADLSQILSRDTAAEEYLRRVREEYQGERYPQALAILDQFLERFPQGSDEAYWLYAQVCEKQGPSRNIRLALDYYRRLTAEYPQSSHYTNARRRIAYLERYYINIQ
jgi:hypothetical protein